MDDLGTFLNSDIPVQWKEHNEVLTGQYAEQVKTIDYLDSSVNPSVILLGLNDLRGISEAEENSLAIPHTQRVRDAFYRYYNWRPEIDLIDLGDVQTGKTLQDTYAAIGEIIYTLSESTKGKKTKIVFFGGSSDLMMGAYLAQQKLQKKFNVTGVSALLPIIPNSSTASDTFLLDMLVDNNSYLSTYSHLAYQSYLNSVELLTKLDQFSFENVRLGQVKERIDDFEPLFRSSLLTYLDLRAVAPTAYPMFHKSPHGLSGEEACRLMQFAGMSTLSSIVHIANYDARKDLYNYYAMLVAQMIWYNIDGFARCPQDEMPTETNEYLFEEHKVAFSDFSSSFFKSKASGRWWMQGPNGKYLACSYSDYELTMQNKIPEKWLRTIE